MRPSSLTTPISPLFVPGDRPERFAKAAASGADAVIIDLEDAVAPSGKVVARSNVRTDFSSLPVIVRINGRGTPWHDDDLAAVAKHRVAAVMLPKADLKSVATCSCPHPLIPLLETARGIVEAYAVAARPSVAFLAFGSVDLAADLGCDPQAATMSVYRAALPLASRFAGLPSPLDGVTLNIHDVCAITAAAAAARADGFGGKLCIHPAQIVPTLDGFRPTALEIEWARSVLETGEGVASIEGEMIDAPVRSRALAILGRSRL